MTTQRLVTLKQRDKEISFYQDQISSVRQGCFSRLSPAQQKSIMREANMIIAILKTESPSAVISVDMILDAIITSLYYKRFGESPVETALYSKRKYATD